MPVIVGTYISIIGMMITGSMGIGLPAQAIGAFGIYIAYMSSFVIVGGAVIYTLTNMLSDDDVSNSLRTLCIPSIIMLYMVYSGFVIYLIPTLIIQIVIILIGLLCV